MDNYATDWMFLKTTTDQDADSPELNREDFCIGGQLRPEDIKED